MKKEYQYQASISLSDKVSYLIQIDKLINSLQEEYYKVSETLTDKELHKLHQYFSIA